MIQVFIIGSSSVYGVGAEVGWGDLIKQKLHRLMYGPGGVGEKYEVFNFSLSGATIDFIQETFPFIFEHYSRNDKTIIIYSVGGNDAKAIGNPDNYVSTIDEFKRNINEMINQLLKLSDNLILLSGWPYDERKVYPKISPFTGKPSYFSNKRRKLFQNEFKKVGLSKKLPVVEIDVNEDEWIQNYLYKDGLHPNQKGYELIAEAVWRELSSLIKT